MKPNQIGRFYLLFITTCLNLSNALNRYLKIGKIRLNFIQFCLSYRLLLLFATFYLELFINIIFSQSLKQITAMILISVFFFYFQPNNFVVGRKCRALYDCEADNEDELTFEEGDIILVINEDTEDDNWMEGCLMTDPGKRGLFPVSFVNMLELES